MPRPRPEDISSAGQDSFLDVVTNIVGILIILVMVVGARVQHIVLTPRPAASCCRRAVRSRTETMSDDAWMPAARAIVNSASKVVPSRCRATPSRTALGASP